MSFAVLVSVGSVTLVIAVLVPLLTALTTKLFADARIKALVNLALSAVVAVLGSLAAVDGFVDLNPRLVLVNFFAAWGTSVVSYYGLWRPTGVADRVGEATENFGLGQTYAQRYSLTQELLDELKRIPVGPKDGHS